MNAASSVSQRYLTTDERCIERADTAQHSRCRLPSIVTADVAPSMQATSLSSAFTLFRMCGLNDRKAVAPILARLSPGNRPPNTGNIYGNATSLSANECRTTFFGVFMLTRSFQSGAGFSLHDERTVSPSSSRIITRFVSPAASM
jgi:hypothetical protein